jgi:hypothetical protein
MLARENCPEGNDLPLVNANFQCIHGSEPAVACLQQALPQRVKGRITESELMFLNVFPMGRQK